MTLRIDEINALTAADFARRFGAVAEHAPWVAAAAGLARPFADRDGMIAAFAAAVEEAPPEAQLGLLRAHPDLAGKAALVGDVTADSRAEQRGAGLDTLTPDELARFTALNDSYRRRFGFPFILAVKGATKHRILAAFAERLDNPPEAELAEAVAQVCRILRFRIEERVAP
ncbi:MAG TPA: 2-oxo-4-hydroxy-4-carboxy-5-ureidoimidazoline decarboxylase [Allosphingosinicella sp.]|nr:2-oxo-4-hydroxy-4-carboxy-5-ureidoimidazoline decarboxylase [Allosphingosinicella sp.]